jgi:intracellular sulfur oxidation DsrE/DsrF family protein
MNRKTMIALMVSASLAAAGCASVPNGSNGSGMSAGPVGPDKVVYHVNNTQAQAMDALRNIGNHLEVNPKAKIVVVSHAQGVDFLFKDAKDKNGNPYDIRVEDLKGKGVQFDVCEITLRNRKLPRDKFTEHASFVPSGVAEITRLQQREGYAYLRP